MTVYGIQPTGYVRKPLNTILSEIEAQMVTEFGPGVIQTSQSPLGQINGLMADLIAEVWELAEAVYQENDPDQAEGVNLEILGRLRLLNRGAEDDAAFRRSITNQGRARIDLQDIARAVASIPGVVYSQVFSNDTAAIDENGLSPASVAVAVIGGDDEEIASTVRLYVVPGINTYGNVFVSTSIDGFCRTIGLVRPIIVPVTVVINVAVFKDQFGCPPPSPAAIKAALISDWEDTNINGKDVTNFTVRSLVEGRYPNVQVVTMTASRDGLPASSGADIGFIEMSQLLPDNVTVNVVA
ncbi:hypothetical protein HQ945_08310 [Phyllobacterium sp. BT25]|uniref:Baseplate protein J-like domain-containing protein n=1 Tax=Phyllobacterium pellucidum TaxID=2740464 RepID=A0A849VP91_9HYPH|nr:hypothetical protein [Phyllobacterium pellucidum]NTS31256.1 hypothetical protein [Phyllobacterium pellucidum]